MVGWQVSEESAWPLSIHEFHGAKIVICLVKRDLQAFHLSIFIIFSFIHNAYFSRHIIIEAKKKILNHTKLTT